MDANSQYELNSIKQELQSIIRELDDVAYGLDADFSNIGNDKAASCVSSVASRYRRVKQKLDNVNVDKVTEEFAAMQSNGGTV